MHVDHVLLAAEDAALSSGRLSWRDGLDSFAGGRHPGWGTANRIVPLGDAYLELVSVVDPDEARASPFGRLVLHGSRRIASPLGWAVRPSDFDGTVRRLALDVREGSRTTPSGLVVSWRSAGLEVVAERPWLPFFIDWNDLSTFPGRVAPPTASLRRISVAGDVDELVAWLGPHQLPLDVTPGNEGVVSVTVGAPDGALVVV